MNTKKYKFMLSRIDNLNRLDDNKTIEDKLMKFKKVDIDYIFNDMSLILPFICCLMDTGSGDGMWKGRAMVFFAATITSLFEITEKYKIKTTPSLINNNLNIRSLMEMLEQIKESSSSERLKNYLYTLPRFEIDLPIEQQDQVVFEQHGFVQMQIAHIFDIMIEKYSYLDSKDSIFRSIIMKNKIDNF